jgi:uncharacterized integral membrane protein (TIGR00698 family)
VALGSRFILGDIAKLGSTSLVQILVDMAVAGTIILVVARAFGLSGKLGSLLAIGTSICGVSAIVAAKGAIRAHNADVSYAIAAILALGAVALFTLPPLGHAIGLTAHEFGLWAGLAVDNTAETTATGYLFSDHAGKIAVVVKSTRNALIGFVVLGFALYWAARGQADEIASGVKAKTVFISEKFPKFVLGFLAVSAIATAGWLSKGQTTNLANVSKCWCRAHHRHPPNRAHRMAPACRRDHRAHRRRVGLAGDRVAHLPRVPLGLKHLTTDELATSDQPMFVPPSAIRRTALMKTSISSNVL